LNKEDLKEILVEEADGEFLKYGKIATHVDVFLTLFGDTSFTFADLSNHKNATQGWQTIFNGWKQQGILD